MSSEQESGAPGHDRHCATCRWGEKNKLVDLVTCTVAGPKCVQHQMPDDTCVLWGPKEDKE